MNHLLGIILVLNLLQPDLSKATHRVYEESISSRRSLGSGRKCTFKMQGWFSHCRC